MNFPAAFEICSKTHSNMYPSIKLFLESFWDRLWNPKSIKHGSTIQLNAHTFFCNTSKAKSRFLGFDQIDVWIQVGTILGTNIVDFRVFVWLPSLIDFGRLPKAFWDAFWDPRVGQNVEKGTPDHAQFSDDFLYDFGSHFCTSWRSAQGRWGGPQEGYKNRFGQRVKKVRERGLGTGQEVYKTDLARNYEHEW